MNFGDIPDENSLEENSKIVILPVPYDMTSTWIKGADNGPDAIIEASAHMELYDIETDCEAFWHGIHTAPSVLEDESPEDMVQAVKERVASFLQKEKFIVVVGGEHSVSIGAIEAHSEKFPGMGVLQLDAHADMREEYEGSKNNHACVMARAKENCPTVQVGIRSMDREEKIDSETIFFAHDIQGKVSWMDEAIALLPEKVYITLDLDVFDPSIMPSTGTPEPGGLLWYETLTFLRRVFEEREVVGFDVVELCPNPTDKAPDFFAAKLIYKMLSYRFGERQ